MGKNCSSITESYKERPLGHYSACAGRGQHASSSRQPLGLRCSRRLEATGNLMFGLSVLGLATVPLSIRTRRRTSILAAPMPVLAVGLAGCTGERGRILAAREVRYLVKNVIRVDQRVCTKEARSAIPLIVTMVRKGGDYSDRQLILRRRLKAAAAVGCGATMPSRQSSRR